MVPYLGNRSGGLCVVGGRVTEGDAWGRVGVVTPVGLIEHDTNVSMYINANRSNHFTMATLNQNVLS